MTNFVIQASESTLYTGDTLFVLFSFILLLFLIGKFAWKPVRKMMLDRQDKINDDIDKANKARIDAIELQQKRQEQLKKSNNDAMKIIEKATANGQQQGDQIVKDAKMSAIDIRQKAEKDVAQSKKEALIDVKDDVADIAIGIATKMIQKELDTGSQKVLVDQYIARLEETNEKNN